MIANVRSLATFGLEIKLPDIEMSIKEIKLTNGFTPANESMSAKFDVCFIFPVVSKDQQVFKPESIVIMDKLITCFGDENILIYINSTGEELIVLLRISDETMKKIADANDTFLLADMKETEARAAIGWPEDSVKPVIIESLPSITNFGAFQYVYLKYRKSEEFSKLYKSDAFEHITRLKIIRKYLEGQKELEGLELKFDALLQEKSLLSVFALHETNLLENLKKTWFHSWTYFFPFNQPLEHIREYMGEKIALYYGFLEHFSSYLTLPAFFGLIAELIVASFENIDHPVAAIYSIFIVVWAVFLSEFWKRREKYIALYHGMIGFEAAEAYRTEFVHDDIIKLSGKEVLFFHPNKRAVLIAESFGILILLCMAVVGTTAGIYVFRLNLASENQTLNSYASIIASILNAVQVQFYGLIYGYLQNQLTDRENHRTDTDYEDSMIFKNYIFAFVNSYTSFFYIAFFAGGIPVSTYPGQPADDPKLQYQGQCGYQTCMEALAINLGIVLGVNIVVSNTTEVLMPYLTNKYNEYIDSKNRVTSSVVVTEPEKESCKTPYDDRAIIGDYLEIMVLFGYMTMFVSALPGSSFVVLGSLWIEIKSDSWKLLNLTRRPWPMEAEDIGTWQDIMDLVIAAAVITNAALIVFTMKLVEMYSVYTQFWIFVGFQWVVFSLQYCIRLIIPDIPMEVQIQKDRADYLNLKLIDKTPDIEVADLNNSISLKMSTDEMTSTINGMIKKSLPVTTTLNGSVSDSL